MFNEILRCVSKDAELVSSPELLEFLGTRSPGTADLTSRDVSVLDTDSQAEDDGEAFDFFQQQERAEGPLIPSQKSEDTGPSSEEEEALDPLGIMRSKKPKKRPDVAVKPRPSPRLTIFDEEVDPDEELFGPGRKPQNPAEDMLHRDHPIGGFCTEMERGTLSSLRTSGLVPESDLSSPCPGPRPRPGIDVTR